MTSRTIKDYYAILGITPNATPEEVRMAFRHMARIYHPDRNGAPDAEERFKDINDAYERLADPQKRQVYDELLNVSAHPDTAPPPPPPSAEPPSYATVTPPPAATTPPQVHPTSRAAQDARRGNAERGNAERGRIYPPTWAILLIMLGAVIIVGVGVAYLLNLRAQRPTGGAEQAKVVKLSTFTSPPAIPENIPVVQESGTPIITVLPNQLNVAGTIYPVVPVMLDQGRWPLPHEQSSIAVWLYGTVINYVVGLPYSSATESVLAGLTSADRIMLTLDNGSVLAFGTPQVQRIDSGDLSPMAQEKPGLTVMMLEGEEATRLIVQARYLPEESIFSQDQRVDGLKVEILETHMEEEEATLYFIIEYQVTNENTTEMNAAFFDMVIEDNAGQRYTLDPTATDRGEYGAFTGVVAPGETIAGSAGYAAPRTMPSPVTWIFRSDTTSAESTRFALTYEPPQPGPALPDVELSSVFDDRTRNVIVINGTIYNDGESPLVVTLDNIKFTYSGGAGTLQASTPLLPWNIGPDGFQDFEVQFSRPQGTDSAILDILGFTYRIEGLE